MRYIAVDGRGHELALLEGVRDFAHAFDEAIIKGRVPGAVNVIGDNAGDDDLKKAEARLFQMFRESGLSEKEAKIAAAGRERDYPIRNFLPTIRVYQSTTTGSSSTAAHLSEADSMQERERRSVDLREPGSIDLASDELTELKERGARNSVAEDLADLYVSFRRSGMSKAEAIAAARGRGYPVSSPIREAGQQLGTPPPPAFAQLMNYPQPDGSVLYQWRVPVCPLCTLRHLIPDPATTMDDPNALLGEQAMPCGKGLAVLTDAATTNSPPDEMGLHDIAKTEAARAEARLYSAFRESGLSEVEAKIAARGRDRR